MPLTLLTQMRTLTFSFKNAILLAIATLLIVACTASMEDVSPILQDTVTPITELESSLPIETVTFSSANLTNTPIPNPDHPPAASPTSYMPLPTTTPISIEATIDISRLPWLIISSNGHLYQTNFDRDSTQQLTNTSEKVEDTNIQSLLPRISPDGEWLALGGRWGGSALIHVADRAEMGIGRGRAFRLPVWSPDSQSLAYLGQDNQLCFYGLSDEQAICPFQAENDLLVAKWSPNGEYVAVVVLETSVSTECCLAQVWLFNTLTEEAEIVDNLAVTLEPVVERLLKWLPNSGGLLIHSETNRLPDALYLLEDQATHQFTEPVRDVAPNGRFLLYESGKIGNINGDVFFDLPTVESSACPREERPIRSWVWSADGEQIAYTLRCPASDEGENWLIIVEAATGDKQWEINLPTNLSLNSWTPDNSSLLLNEYSPLPEEWAIWQISSDGQNPPEKILSQAILLSYVPAWNKE